MKWQQAVFEVLLSYHPFWLRLGLEAVVGQLLPADTGDLLRHIHAGSNSWQFTIPPASAMVLLSLTLSFELSNSFHGLTSSLMLPGTAEGNNIKGPSCAQPALFAAVFQKLCSIQVTSALLVVPLQERGRVAGSD